MKEEINILTIFCKKILKEDSVDGQKIRSIIEELEAIKRENTTLNFTVQEQADRIEKITAEAGWKNETVLQSNSTMQEKLDQMENKGKELIKMQDQMRDLRAKIAGLKGQKEK